MMPFTSSIAPALLAAGLDWLEGLLPVLFVIFWIVSQIWSVVRRAGGPPREQAPRPAQPARPRRKPVEPAVPNDGRGRLEQEIEAFLREADRPRVPETRQTEPPKRRDRPVRQPTAKPTARRGERPAPPPPQPQQPIATADTGGERPASAAFGSDVARHVSEAFATDLRHQIGAPAATETAPAKPEALDIAKLLRDPESLRHLVIVREVLDRPVERW